MARKLTDMRLGVLSEIPPHILDKLSIPASTEKQEKIVDIIRDLKGYACIDEILVHMYKEHEITFERNALTAMLYRMKNLNLLKTLPRKGYYALPDFEPKDLRPEP